jgi:hypothetical protein
MPSFPASPESGGVCISRLRWSPNGNSAPRLFAEHNGKISMKNVRLFVLAGCLAAVSASAGTLTETFTNNPSLDGWQAYGDTNLFQWDPTNLVLDVTWDSSQPNSYFYHSLGATLTRNSDFTISFDMLLNTATASGYGFQVSLGLLNYADATNSDFLRWSGYNSPNLVEFDYFPDVGYGPTVWPLFVDWNSDFNFNSASDYAIYAPNLGDWYHIVMTYSSASQMMVTTMTNFEQTSGITITDPFASYFLDFAVDTFSISSYQDDGMGDSVYAQGAIGNISVTSCPPPVQDLAGAFAGAAWQAQLFSLTNWVYTLQRATNFMSGTNVQCWTNVGATTPGNGAALYLQDSNAPTTQAFYRVVASKP